VCVLTTEGNRWFDSSQGNQHESLTNSTLLLNNHTFPGSLAVAWHFWKCVS
jgi:hypothetical protein